MPLSLVKRWRYSGTLKLGNGKLDFLQGDRALIRTTGTHARSRIYQLDSQSVVSNYGNNSPNIVFLLNTQFQHLLMAFMGFCKGFQ